MTRRRRLPRHLLEVGTRGRAAQAPRRGTVDGPIASAWLAAVESALTPSTRTIARKRLATAHTRRVVLEPGYVRAEVRQASYRNQLTGIRISVADAAEWDRLLAVAATHGRWLAAFAAGELPHDLAAGLLEAGLVPAGNELTSECTCRTEPGLCVHAAIAGHVAAAALTVDPTGMLVLRGLLPERVRERVVGLLPGGHAGGARRDPAVIDWNALVPGSDDELPRPPAAPPTAGRPAPLPPPPAASGLLAGELEDLAADAAERALELLVAGGDGSLGLDADADLARRAAAMSPAGVAALAEQMATSVQELAALACTWRAGGAGAVGALRRPWHAAPRSLESGIVALRAAGGDVTWRTNRVIARDGLTELALGRDGLWYLLTRERRSSPLVVTRPGAGHPGVLLGGSPGRHEARPSEPPAVEQLRLL